MADYTLNARTIINSFLWNELKQYEIFDEDQYRLDDFTKEVVPIIPTQQIPEFNNLIGDKPYIVYDYEVMGYDDAWWVCEESMLFTVVGTKVSQVSEIVEFMVDLFRRFDDSGKDLQQYNPNSDKVIFYTVYLQNATSPGPFDMEGGRMAASVEISYKYSRVLNSSGRFA